MYMYMYTQLFLHCRRGKVHHIHVYVQLHQEQVLKLCVLSMIIHPVHSSNKDITIIYMYMYIYRTVVERRVVSVW